jgi:hypothetical protein
VRGDPLILASLWLLACTPSGDPPTTHDGPPPDDAADQEQCDDPSWARLECPAGYTPQKFTADLEVLELEDVAQPVCGGRGIFIPAGALEEVDQAGFQVTQNSVCAFGCFGTCGAGLNVCVTEHADGSPCARVCSILGKDDCRDAAQRCDPERACER